MNLTNEPKEYGTGCALIRTRLLLPMYDECVEPEDWPDGNAFLELFSDCRPLQLDCCEITNSGGERTKREEVSQNSCLTDRKMTKCLAQCAEHEMRECCLFPALLSQLRPLTGEYRILSISLIHTFAGEYNSL